MSDKKTAEDKKVAEEVGVSEETLASMDEAAENLKDGKVSEPINDELDKHIDEGKLDNPDSSKETVEEKPEEKEKDERRSGVKEVAENADVMAIEKDAEGGDALPSFFVDKDDRIDIEVDVLSSQQDGRIVSISRKGLGVDFDEFPYLNHSVAKFSFSAPTYDEMSSYRRRSAVFRNEAQQMVVDRVQLRNYFLVWHLRDWSLKNRDGSKVELEHDKEGSLSDESMTKVYSVQPTLIDVVMTLFEKDMLLT